MPKAFLSHSSQDKELVSRIAAKLGNKNITLDEISFDPGRKTLDEIFNELGKSDLFVLFISENSLQSKWVSKEISIAKQNLKKEILDRILPIIVDPKITYSDPRIPNWISKPYNLKYISNEVIILKKIKQAMLEISFKKSKFNEKLEEIFVGRNDEVKKFENDINNLNNWTPSFVIAYNRYEGIGRRKFLLHALRKENIIDALYVPTTITLDAKESIESFIYKLNTINKDRTIIDLDLSSLSIEDKISKATEIVNGFVQLNEIIFIIDDGGIVLPNGEIVNWFNQLVADERFENCFVFGVVSRYRPNQVFLKKQGKSLTYMIPELSKQETKNLFLRLLRIFELDTIPIEIKEKYLAHLTGIPSQIIYAVNIIHINPLEAKKKINDVIEYSDDFSSTIISELSENETAYQLAILLSKNEILSYELIIKVFGDNERTSDALQLLFDLSIFNFVLGGYEYLKLNPMISDYINRTKIKLNPKFKNKLQEITQELLNENLDEVLLNDYSEFMITINQMMADNQKVPSKYFMPSLILKNVINEYNKGHYENVIKICLDLLENGNYDDQILRETRYRLLLAYARLGNEKFFDHISYFSNEGDKLDYYFLCGFYHRNKNEKDKALKYYYDALDVYPNHSITKREIVNILLAQRKYAEALEMAKENYERQKTNILHIQSYFICLIRKNVTYKQTDLDTINKLREAVKNSKYLKAKDISPCMDGEYEFFVNHDFDKAKRILLRAIHTAQNKSFPIKTLSDIYRKNGMESAFKKLRDNNFRES